VEALSALAHPTSPVDGLLRNDVIADIRTVVVRAELRTWLFVEIETKEGRIGVGEGSQSRNDVGVIAAIERLRPRLVDQPLIGAIEKFVNPVLRSPFPSRVEFCAVSSCEQALWDLTGQVLNARVCDLLGGAIRDRVRCYANVALSAPSLTPESIAASAAAAVADGFTAVKIYPFGTPELGVELPRSLTRRDRDLAVSRVGATREAIGPNCDLLIDLGWMLAPADARRFLSADLYRFDPFWVEEPYPTPDLAELRRLRSAPPIRVAAGEQIHGRRGFRELCEARAVDVVMPDVKWVGGISEARKVAALAESFDVDVSMHNMSGPVSTAASIHVAATLPTGTLLEWCFGNTPWRAELIGGQEQVVDGYAPVPSGPGLGVHWDAKAARAHQ
jgi:galactonate dehydratase